MNASWKIKLMVLASVFAVCLVGVTQQAHAIIITLNLSSPEYIGQAIDGAPANNDADVIRINELIAMVPGSGPTLSDTGDDLYRSGNTFVDLPTAVEEGAVGHIIPSAGDLTPGGLTEIDLGSGYSYLVAKYDGQNFGTAVWFVGDLSGEIHIPDNIPYDNKWQLSGWALYNPNSVPDGGESAMLLGLAMLGLGGLKRLIRG